MKKHRKILSLFSAILAFFIVLGFARHYSQTSVSGALLYATEYKIRLDLVEFRRLGSDYAEAFRFYIVDNQVIPASFSDYQLLPFVNEKAKNITLALRYCEPVGKRLTPTSLAFKSCQSDYGYSTYSLEIDINTQNKTADIRVTDEVSQHASTVTVDYRNLSD